MKIADLEERGRQITNDYIEGKSIEETIRKMSSDSTDRIQIVDGMGNIIFPNDWMGIFYFTSYNRDLINAVLASVPKVEGSHYVYPIKVLDDRYQTFIYASYLGQVEDRDLYLMIVSLVEPIDSTVQIMRRQFPYIIGIVLAIGMIVSYFISKKLSAPVLDLNKTTKDLALGKSDIKFKKSGVYETDQLADTLNFLTQELSKMEEMRVSIVANVSHDLKTPLTVIKSYSEMIKDITGDNEELRNQNLDTIISETDRLTEMVNSILNVSKLEMQMHELNPEELSLKEMTEDIISRLDILRQKQGYNFIIEGNSDGWIKADRSMIYQVLYNFASNAVSFVGPDKQIIFKIEEDQESVSYSVIDHGRGISKKDQEKIWERYYTDHHNHIRNVVGTGLGLHIVRVILKKHGFKYGVESQEGQGSRFYFIAPKIS
ncbi:MAG: HAMP domain-containing sensor histidine kinase [Bacillota bacterium]|nr:HAMP domain-containing sensor histidine kinase [Bacillota bacterium]